MALTDLVSRHNWDGSADDIEATMSDFYPDVMELAYSDVGPRLPVDVSFDLSNPAIRKTIKKLATKVRDVSDTTRNEIRAIIDTATQEGLSVGDIAKRIMERGEINSRSRAVMVARSESAVAYNLGATHAYEDAGVKKVEVLDGDDDEECANANGQIWTLEEARDNPIAHPNCLRAFAPYLED